MQHRAARVVGVVALLCAALVLPARGSQAAADQAATPPAPDLPSIGEVDEEAYAAAWEEVLRAPDRYAGVHLADDATVALVAGPEGRNLRPRAFRGVLLQGPLSYTGLKEREQAVAEGALEGSADGVFAFATSDPVTGRVDVVLRASDPALEGDLAQEYGGAVSVTVDPSIPVFTSAENRSWDNSPHNGGSKINRRQPGGASTDGYCSTAFAVTINGVNQMMSAGHCFPGRNALTDAYSYLAPGRTPTSSSLWFGRRSTTTFVGTQDTLGDWAPLRGSRYQGRIYNAGPAPSSTTAGQGTLPVQGVTWTPPAIGSGLCTSGATTGQICRQYVTHNDATVPINYGPDFGTVNVAHQIQTFSDQDQDGERDTGGTCRIQPGDSGGAAYEGSRAGGVAGVRVLGIVTGFGAPCRSIVTNLVGLRGFYGAGNISVVLG